MTATDGKVSEAELGTFLTLHEMPTITMERLTQKDIESDGKVTVGDTVCSVTGDNVFYLNTTC